MRVVNTYQPVEDYLDALKGEIGLVRARLPQNTRISHLHFGGGSPTIIKPHDFQKLVEFLSDKFPFLSNMEIGVEADPRHLSEAKIAAYAQSGVNRLSIGVQDFNEEVLNLINRPQPFHVTYRGVELARAYGIDNINFDLMYGLPAQNVETILKTMELALSLRPSRIAYFGYAHVPWMKRHMNLMPQDRIPVPDERYLMQEAGAAAITKAGYTPVGIDHYALPDDSMARALEEKTLHRNFQGYTTDAAECLVGLGASSISAFAQGHSQNKVDARTYMDDIRAARLPVHKLLVFGGDDLARRSVIEDIMCYLETDLSRIERVFSLPDGSFSDELEKLKSLECDGIVTLDGSIVKVNPDYRVLARIVCEVFDSYAVRNSAIKRHAQAV